MAKLNLVEYQVKWLGIETVVQCQVSRGVDGGASMLRCWQRKPSKVGQRLKGCVGRMGCASDVNDLSSGLVRGSLQCGGREE